MWVQGLHSVGFDLRKDRLRKLSVNSPEGLHGVGVQVAIDRFRDLLRRAILARLLLADLVPNGWPLSGEYLVSDPTGKSKQRRPVDVDAALTDAGQRERWRQWWRSSLANMGVEKAADRAADVEDTLHARDN
jgi:hypothetical protein